jgi:hypothetical protein
MTIHVLKGSKQEIADTLVRFGGDVREAIVFVDEPPPPPVDSQNGTAGSGPEDMFDEMRACMVDAHDVDDSREAIYRGDQGE